MLLVVAAGGLYYTFVTHQINDRMEQLRSTRATQFYALYPPFRLEQHFTRGDIKSFLLDQGYVERKNADELLPREYAVEDHPPLFQLTLSRSSFSGAGYPMEATQAKLSFESPAGGTDFILKQITRLDTNESIPDFESIPKKIAAYFAGRLRTQNAVALPEIPVSMRLAVMAIEDVHFLEHGGISLKGTIRALWKDLLARRWVEGGSTITQQLMKNLFFSREKAISRKIKEALYAFVTESRHSKEAILEAYLNEVYMGQAGTHEIHGVSEGAQYYFSRPVSQLSMSQSATLAAIIQAPNAQDPHRYPDRTLKRRNLVLKKMLDSGFIEQSEYDAASVDGIGVTPFERSLNDVDYANDLVLERLPLDVRQRLDYEKMTIYVTLNPYLQSAASRLLKAQLENLQKNVPALKKKAAMGHQLQGALIAIDVKECSLSALQGGSSYRQTQFNRILQGLRQPGSLFKPFVFLAGFRQEKDPITPLTELEDSPFEWKYDNQVWKPKNYEDDFRGKVTAREALEHSINTATARLAERVGIPAMVDTLKRAGIRANLPLVPSLALGSADVTPLEVAEAYTTLANLGKQCTLRPFYKIFDSNKNLIFENPLQLTEVLPLNPTFQTISLMKGVFTHGTAQLSKAWNLPLSNFAGKTGTTNDERDAWFVGFSPSLLVLVWVGYDEKEVVGLTGAGAALPLWLDFVKSAGPFLASDDFAVPEGLKPVLIDRVTHQSATSTTTDSQLEYFVPGTQP